MVSQYGSMPGSLAMQGGASSSSQSPSRLSDNSASKATFLLRLENRLPAPLRCVVSELSDGVWVAQPPANLVPYSMVLLGARGGGLVGQRGTRGRVLYRCEYGKRSAVLVITFESQSFGNRALNCWEESESGMRRAENILCIQQDLAGGEAGSGGGVVTIGVELLQNYWNRTLPARLRSSKLADTLKQAGRSALIRITNLTQQELVFDAAQSPTMNAGGFWLMRPADHIGPLAFHDFGISGHGLHLSTRGEVVYTLLSPRTAEEARVQIKIVWSVPFLGTRHLEASVQGGSSFIVESHSDGLQNLTGSVHVVDRRCLPVLEIINGVALARQDAEIGWARGGADVTQHMLRYMCSRHEIRVPSARALLDQPEVEAGSAEGVELPSTSFQEASLTHIGVFQISYRIGPEIFRRDLKPNEQVHLSAAMPGGDGRSSTILDAVGIGSSELEAEGAERPKHMPQLTLQDGALLCQRLLSAALSPIVCQAVAPGDLPRAHLWPRGEETSLAADPDAFEDLDAGPECGVERLELDLEGLLLMLRNHLEQINRYTVSAADRSNLPGVGKVPNPATPPPPAPPLSTDECEALLPPLDDLCAEWAERADASEDTVEAALVAAVELLKAFKLEAAADEVEGVLRSHQEAKAKADASAKAAKRQLRHRKQSG